MSRIGFKPISLPSGITVTVNGNTATVKGAKGEVSVLIPSDVSVEVKDGKAQVKIINTEDARQGNENEGTVAANLKNAIHEIHREVNLVINIACPDEELIRRISTRRVCPKCGASYNVVSMKPKKEGICDVCGSALIQRKDDNEASLKVRLANYYKSTAPLLDFYKSSGVLYNFDGMLGAEKLKKELNALLARHQ